MADADIKGVVKEKYSQAALRVSSGGTTGCGPAAAGSCDPISSNLYEDSEA
jgi:arsenite methyltransferase